MDARTFRIVIGGAAVYKALDVSFVAPAWIIVPLLIGGVSVLALQSDRLGWVVALGGLVINLSPVYWNHLTLLVWAALAMAIFTDLDQRAFVLKTQLSVVYGFAALAKIWPDWLSGQSLVAYTWLGPQLPDGVLVTLAWMTIALEAVLAVGVWHSWRGWFWLAAGLHGGFVIFIDTNPVEVLRLVAFATISLAMWLHARDGVGRALVGAVGPEQDQPA